MSNRKEPYASEAESAAVIAPYTLSAAGKKLHDMMDERGAWEQGAETYPVLYQIAIELLEREAQVVQSTTENSSAVEQLAPQGSLRCNTPKKCALYVCSPLAWPSEQPVQPPVACPTCGEYEPRTGTCGTSPTDKRALCNRRDQSPPAQQQEPSVAAVWQQGYDQGVVDERTSEANIGIAGFDAKVNPARNNPYSAEQPALTATYTCGVCGVSMQMEQPAQPQQEFPLRGILASELKCWHRLTEDEAQNLLAFVQNMPSKPAQQEPYCWMSPEGTIYQASDEDVLKGSIPMYLGKPPAQRKPLTVQEIDRIYTRYGGDMMNCARAIERAHGIKGQT